MNYTTYYKLQKPLGTEKYDIEVHNANADVIDAALDRLEHKNLIQDRAISEEIRRASVKEEEILNSLQENKLIWDDKFKKIPIPTKTSELENDCGFGTITGIKGEKESEYHSTGNVNLTADNVGAIPVITLENTGENMINLDALTDLGLYKIKNAGFDQVIAAGESIACNNMDLFVGGNKDYRYQILLTTGVSEASDNFKFREFYRNDDSNPQEYHITPWKELSGSRNITKESIGLGNVDDTPDAEKYVKGILNKSASPQQAYDFDFNTADGDNQSGYLWTDGISSSITLKNTNSSGVTGIKGNTENTYRTGNVNLTPDNIGALNANGYGNLSPTNGRDVFNLDVPFRNGTQRFYVVNNNGESNAAATGRYLKMSGQIFCLNTGECAGFIFQLFFDPNTGRMALRKNVTQGDLTFSYETPIYHVDAWSGGTITGQLISNNGSSKYWNGRDIALISQKKSNGYFPLISSKTINGSWEISTYDAANEGLCFVYMPDESYNRSVNGNVKSYYIHPDGTSNITSEKASKDGDGNIIANTYVKNNRVTDKIELMYSQDNESTYIPNLEFIRKHIAYNDLGSHAYASGHTENGVSMTLTIDKGYDYLLFVKSVNASTGAFRGATVRMIMKGNIDTEKVSSLTLAVTSNTGFTITLGTNYISIGGTTTYDTIFSMYRLPGLASY